MSTFSRMPRWLLKIFHYPPQAAYRIGLGPLFGRLILLLTTTGRKTGRRRVTPLQYEEIDSVIYVAAGYGKHSDWYRNIAANPCVEVRVGSRRFEGLASPVTDPSAVADFLALRLQRHPRMMGAMLRMEGLPANPDRPSLERFAGGVGLVRIAPVYAKGQT